MDGLSGRFRQLYDRAGGVLEDWSHTHARASDLFAAAANIAERLPMLANPAAFESLPTDACGGPHVQPKVFSAQIAALDRLVGKLRIDVESFRALADALERIARDAAVTLRDSKPPAKASGAARRGPVPAPAECVAALDNLWRIHRDEAALKCALMNAVSLDASAEEWSKVAEVFVAQPNLDPADVRKLMDTAPVHKINER